MRQLVASIVLIASAASAQTIGLIDFTPGNTDGYVLFSPIPWTTTYLIDKCGRQVHSWNSTCLPGDAVYLLDDGSLLRAGNANNAFFNAGGKGGLIERFDWDGNLDWSYTVSDAQQCAHHDIRPMPNGHVLVIAWERHTVANAIASGRKPDLLGNSLWSEKILELEPVGSDQANVVWEWHLWDHLVQDFDSTKLNFGVIADHPELVDLNYVSVNVQADWIHMNALDYNADLDQIMLSSHNFSEVWVIDHSTTTAQAASHSGGDSEHGGDLIYRWGDPQTYGRGTPADQVFYGQHNVQWIRPGLPNAGDILVFNNGLNRPGTPYSAVDILAPAVDAIGHYMIDTLNAFAPDTLLYEWTATPPTDFYAVNISSAQQLPGGGFMVCDGPAGTFFELDAGGNEVWRYISPVNTLGPMTQGAVALNNSVFRCTWIPPDHPGLAGHSLTPGDPIELSPIANSCSSLSIGEEEESRAGFFPDPASDHIQLECSSALVDVAVIDALGRMVKRWDRVMGNGLLDLGGIDPGRYVVKIGSGGTSRSLPLVIAR